MNIIALFQNNRISFFSDDNNQISHIKNSSLFFYFDKLNNSFNNSEKYEILALDNNANTYFNIISKFAKKQKLNNPLAKDYGFFIDEIFSDITSTYKNYELIELVFSNSIQNSEKEKIIPFLTARYKISEKTFNLPEILSKNYIIKNQTGTTISDINIIETIEHDLILSQCNFANQEVTISTEKVHSNFIFEPTAYSIAKTIVDDIDRLYKTKNNKNQIKKNITFTYLKIKNKATEIENLPKKFATISSKLIDSTERYTVRIDNTKLKLLKKVYLKNIIDSLNKAQFQENTPLLIISDFFHNSEVKDYILDYFSNVKFITIEEILKTRADNFPSENDEYSTMFLEATPEDIENEEFEKVSTLDINELDVGDQIKLTNYDSRPNKGYSTQQLEGLGNKKFVILESTRSLKTGDLVESEEAIWHSGIKLIFEVTRNGKIYGRFQTREIQTVEVYYKKR